MKSSQNELHADLPVWDSSKKQTKQIMELSLLLLCVFEAEFLALPQKKNYKTLQFNLFWFVCRYEKTLLEF